MNNSGTKLSKDQLTKVTGGIGGMKRPGGDLTNFQPFSKIIHTPEDENTFNLANANRDKTELTHIPTHKETKTGSDPKSDTPLAPFVFAPLEPSVPKSFNVHTKERLGTEANKETKTAPYPESNISFPFAPIIPLWKPVPVKPLTIECLGPEVNKEYNREILRDIRFQDAEAFS